MSTGTVARTNDLLSGLVRGKHPGPSPRRFDRVPQKKKALPETESARITGIVSEGNYIRLWVKRFRATAVAVVRSDLLISLCFASS